MTAKELFDAGQLSAAIEQLNQDVRARPLDVGQRTFLFELLCFAGDYQRAIRQLDALTHQDAANDIGAQVYRNLITAAETRDQCFTQGGQPDFLFPPPAYAVKHVEALQRLSAAQPEVAKTLLEETEPLYPRHTGCLNGQAFEDFCDGDPILGPFLEIFAQNAYIWFPIEQIKQLMIPPPAKLRDLLWAPATLEAHAGPVGDVFLPVLYPGSCAHADEAIKLGRMTDWLTDGAGLSHGIGQHVFLVGEDARSLLEMRELSFDAGASPVQA